MEANLTASYRTWQNGILVFKKAKILRKPSWRADIDVAHQEKVFLLFNQNHQYACLGTISR